MPACFRTSLLLLALSGTLASAQTAPAPVPTEAETTDLPEDETEVFDMTLKRVK